MAILPKSTFSQIQLTGVDPQWESLQEAKRIFQFNNLLNSTGGMLPFKNKTFKSCICNSVLEHIPGVDSSS